MKINILYVLLVGFLITILFSHTVFAYIDPGTGSIIFQAIAAAALGIGFAFKMSYRRIKGLFKRDKTEDEETS